MKRKRKLWLTLLAALVWCAVMTVSVCAGGAESPDEPGGKRVYDMAGLFGTSRTEDFEEEIEECRRRYGLDVVVVTTEAAEGKSSRAYADDFYDEGGFGQGSGKDGILFLIDMDNRELYVSPCGKAIRIFTDDRIETVLDHAYEDASREDYEACVDSFLSDVESYCRAGIPGNQYNYDTETGEVHVYRSIRWYEALMALGISAFAAGSACLTVKRRYGMEESPAQVSNLNMAYRAQCGFRYDGQEDRLVNKFVTSRVIPRSTSGHGHSGGGGRSSSGRSSTHRSSSGRVHGGGGRKF